MHESELTLHNPSEALLFDGVRSLPAEVRRGELTLTVTSDRLPIRSESSTQIGLRSTDPMRHQDGLISYFMTESGTSDKRCFLRPGVADVGSGANSSLREPAGVLLSRLANEDRCKLITFIIP